MDHYFLTLINGEGPLFTIQRLKEKCDETLSNFAFNFNLRRHTKVWDAMPLPRKFFIKHRGFGQGLTLVHTFQLNLSRVGHLSLSSCLIDWGEIMHPTYPTKCAYVEPDSGRA
jgi:hypothetical protein